ncbi:hypothetical protein HNY73_002288 [Argiope bruennichi]|uniref:Uncharacterized protein n=1 Tax=Argiope bruennichi TaxID=94029 RepID=A0A8T0FVI9_ARGBR|nr:hypothetical protein HNY73_002288 [Argiope bruennichi]
MWTGRPGLVTSFGAANLPLLSLMTCLVEGVSEFAVCDTATEFFLTVAGILIVVESLNSEENRMVVLYFHHTGVQLAWRENHQATLECISGSRLLISRGVKSEDGPLINLVGADNDVNGSIKRFRLTSIGSSWVLRKSVPNIGLRDVLYDEIPLETSFQA